MIYLTPFLIATFSVISLAANNIVELPLREIVMALSITLFCTAILFLITKIIVKRTEKASLLTSLFIILIFSYGHVSNWIGVVTLSEHRLLVIGYLAIALLAFIAILRTKHELKKINYFLLVFGSILVLTSLITFSFRTLSNQLPTTQSNNEELKSNIDCEAKNQKCPNVYYILVDGYPSNWGLNNFFDFDNQEFLNFLREKDFFVPLRSYSNYNETAASLPTLLNMDYIENLLPDRDINYVNQITLMPNHTVGKFFKGLGYTYKHFGSHWNWTSNIEIADNAKSTLFPLQFLQLLYNTTIMRPIISGLDTRNWAADSLRNLAYLERNKWQLVKNQIEKLKTIEPDEKPQFVFTHISVPHDLLFNGDGSLFDLKPDLNDLEATDKLFTEAYVAQLNFFNEALKEIIEHLQKEDPDAVIILQSDHGDHGHHGPGAPTEEANGNNNLQLDNLDDTAIQRGIRNFSAFYTPDAGNIFYEGITPVNIFRILFNNYFGTDLEILSDKSFISSHIGNYGLSKIIDVTERAAY